MHLKRAFDVAGATVLLVGLAVPLALGACAVLVTLGRPVLFWQQRSGRFGRPFMLAKLRTMHPGADGVSEAARLGVLGRWLRALSIDELPQLWNVLRGDMSLVGPRPLLPAYLSRYSPVQARRHEVLPGLTGLAQVSGRNTLDWDRKFALDVWYVRHRTPALDLWILWRTALIVLRPHGVNAPGHTTMPEFVGSRRSEAKEETCGIS